MSSIQFFNPLTGRAVRLLNRYHFHLNSERETQIAHPRGQRANERTPKTTNTCNPNDSAEIHLLFTFIFSSYA